MLATEVCLLVLAALPGLFFDVPASGWAWLGSWTNVFALACVLLGGIPILIETIHALARKDVTADVLFLIALAATEIIGGEQHVAGATLVLMMGSGEFLEAYLGERTSGYVGELARLEPETAIVRGTGTAGPSMTTIPVGEIKAGDTVVVRRGERIPVDGLVIAGHAEIDASLVTGERDPVIVSTGHRIVAGTLVLDGTLDVGASAPSSDSFLGKIGRVIARARLDKPRLQLVTDRWARLFLPMVLSIATATWILTGNVFYTISVLLVSCPCSLVISVPAAFIASLGNAARRGIWVRSGKAVESLGQVNTVALDKTGTLTLGEPEVARIEATGPLEAPVVLQVLHAIESLSTHPFAKAIVAHVETTRGRPAPLDVSGITHEPGLGVTAVVEQHGRVNVGNASHLATRGVAPPPGALREGEYALFLFDDAAVLGIVRFHDMLRKDARGAVAAIRAAGARHVVVLSGDSQDKTSEVGEYVGADLVLGGVEPAGKLRFIQEARANGAFVAMVGDGVNDAPAIAAADVGIAMGKHGSAVACEEADVIVSDDDLAKVARAIRLGRRCVRKAITNIVIAILFNFFGILLSATGLLVPVGAAAWHVLQSLVVVGNAALLARHRA